jgi:hypothetical protein
MRPSSLDSNATRLIWSEDACQNRRFRHTRDLRIFSDWKIGLQIESSAFHFLDKLFFGEVALGSPGMARKDKRFAVYGFGIGG